MNTPILSAVGEELRENLLATRRELDLLRTEARHANLLLDALDSLLAVGYDEDPFAGAFAAVKSIFDYSHALALVEASDESDAGDALECVSSSHDALVGSQWPVDRLLERVLSGRVLTTIADPTATNWPAAVATFLSSRQPALYLPLRVRERRGLLMLLRAPDAEGFDRSHVTLARKFSVLASHAFAASRAHQTEAERHRLTKLTEGLEASREELTHRANHDQLTGLPNRTHIQERVDARIGTLAAEERLALAFFDIDHFKQVNDYYGHAAGDALLKGVADRIRDEIRSTDLLGRISGDEFVLALAPVTQRAQITDLIQRIRMRIQEPLEIDGATIKASASIGVSIYPVHGHDYETLRRNADTAMYQAKTTSKGSIGFFNQALGRLAAEKMSLERRLRKALDQRQFTYVLQPKVSIHDCRIVGFEALVRWIDDEGKVQPPAKFLALANELGLLDGISQSIIDSLAADLPRLDARFGSGIRYNFNVSAQQASKPVFMESLLRQVTDLGCAPRLIMELTEDALVATSSFQAQVLPLMREAGVGLSIDDFGTGFSCLSVLADITADELKVDRSLIASIQARPRNQSILRAIVSLSDALGMTVVAEGIETRAERDYLLKSTSIAFGQGYLFSRPLFVDDLLAASIQGPFPPHPDSAAASEQTDAYPPPAAAYADSPG